MSLLAKVEQMLAEESDGLVKAVKHLAGEVEKPAIAGLDVGAIEADLRANAAGLFRSLFEQKATEFFAAAKAHVDAKLAELEGEVSAALAKLHAPAAAAPADPVQVPQSGEEQAPQQAS